MRTLYRSLITRTRNKLCYFIVYLKVTEDRVTVACLKSKLNPNWRHVSIPEVICKASNPRGAIENETFHQMQQNDWHFFPEILELQAGKKHQSVLFSTNNFCKTNLKFFGIFFFRASQGRQMPQRQALISKKHIRTS